VTSNLLLRGRVHSQLNNRLVVIVSSWCEPQYNHLIAIALLQQFSQRPLILHELCRFIVRVSYLDPACINLMIDEFARQLYTMCTGFICDATLKLAARDCECIHNLN